MATENEQFAREKELAREYAQKMESHFQKIDAMAFSRIPGQHGVYQSKALLACFAMKYTEAFSQNKYEKPSLFFLAEMPWIFRHLVYDRFREAFLQSVDQILDYPYSHGLNRRRDRKSVV